MALAYQCRRSLTASRARPGGITPLDVAVGKCEERRPVRAGGVAALVLPEGELAGGDRRLQRGELRRAEVLLSQQPENRSGGNRRQEASALVDPLPFGPRAGRGTIADERRPRRAHCDQLVGVDRQVVRRERAAVLQEVARHPVVFARTGQILDQLSEVAAVQLRATLAR